MSPQPYRKIQFFRDLRRDWEDEIAALKRQGAEVDILDSLRGHFGEFSALVRVGGQAERWRWNHSTGKWDRTPEAPE